MTTIGDRRYRVHHRTRYDYGREMMDGYTVANLLARPTPTQLVVSTELTTDPDVDERDERTDTFGNRVVQLGIHTSHDHLTVDVETEVVVSPASFPRGVEPWERVAALTAAARGVQALDVSPFRSSSRFVPLRGPDAQAIALETAFASEFQPGRPVLDVVGGVCSAIFHGFVFDPTATTASTPLGDVLAARRGVCQDFAHLAVGVFRVRGLAARYVSGYIETDPPLGEPKTIGADASHAWCSVWLPDHGWMDLDPTNDIVGPDRHVTVGWGRDYADVAPIRGVVIGPSSAQTLAVEVDVTRV